MNLFKNVNCKSAIFIPQALLKTRYIKLINIHLDTTGKAKEIM